MVIIMDMRITDTIIMGITIIIVITAITTITKSRGITGLKE
jgi:hypothetical protein